MGLSSTWGANDTPVDAPAATWGASDAPAVSTWGNDGTPTPAPSANPLDAAVNAAQGVFGAKPGDVQKALQRAWNEGVSGILGGASETARLAESQVTAPGTAEPPSALRGIQKVLSEVPRGVSEAFGGAAKGAGDLAAATPAPQTKGLITDVASAVGGAAPYVLGGEAAPLLMGAGGIDQVRKDAQAHGVAGSSQANSAEIANGLLQAGLGKIPVGELLDKIPPAFKNQVIDYLARVGIHAGGGAALGTAMQVGTNVVEKSTFAPDTDILANVPENAGVMAAFGGIHALIPRGVHGEAEPGATKPTWGSGDTPMPATTAGDDYFNSVGAGAHPNVAQASGIITQLEGGLNKDGSPRVSPAGAIGQYQVMPETARKYLPGGANMTVDQISAQLRDPNVNARVGQAIISDLLHTYNGNMSAVAIAYNAGPKRANEYEVAGAGTALQAIVGPRGGVTYERVAAPKDESFLPLETQKYLANMRRHSGEPLPAGGGVAPEPGIVAPPPAPVAGEAPQEAKENGAPAAAPPPAEPLNPAIEQAASAAEAAQHLTAPVAEHPAVQDVRNDLDVTGRAVSDARTYEIRRVGNNDDIVTLRVHDNETGDGTTMGPMPRPMAIDRAAELEAIKQPAGGAPTAALPTPPPEPSLAAATSLAPGGMFGASNTVFTPDAAAAARERLRTRIANEQGGFVRKLSNDSGSLDVETLTDAFTLGGYYVEGGVRAFGDWSAKMLDDLGEAIRPHLRQVYNYIRDDDSAQHLADSMTPYHEVTREAAAAAGRREALPRESVEETLRRHLTESGTATANGKTYTAPNRTEAEIERAVGLMKVERDRMVPTERVEAQSQIQANQALRDTIERQPSGMPAAGKPVEKDPNIPQWTAGETVRLKPENAHELPNGDAPRKVLDTSAPGNRVTLDGGAVVDATHLETNAAATGRAIPEEPANEHPGDVRQKPASAESKNAGGASAKRGTRGSDNGSGKGGEGEAVRTPGSVPETPERGGEGQDGADAGGGNRPGSDSGLPGPTSEAAAGAGNGPADAAVKGQNFLVVRGGADEGRGLAQKARDNLEAIKLVKEITAQNRPATREEQAILAKYVGWGGLKGAFPDSKGNVARELHSIAHELKTILTPEEHQTAARSVQYAHYTAENVVRAMWQAVRDMGFKGGQVFEPGMGIGNFLGMAPPELTPDIQYHGIEMDHLTASIAKLLYPKAGVRQADFVQMALPENRYDLVIGNPPFSDRTVKADPKYAARRFMLHDYFFAKSLDSVRPGGLLAFVTSAGTMNKLDYKPRRWMAERAEFVGGVRLPSDAFQKSANTSVTTDILFFRKREVPVSKEEAAAEPWTGTITRNLPNGNERWQGPTHEEGTVSRYFSEHPEMVLGDEGFWGDLYAGRYGVHARLGVDFDQELHGALDRLPKDVMGERQTPAQKIQGDLDSGQTKDGSYYVKDGRLMVYRAKEGKPVPKLGSGDRDARNAEDQKRILSFIPMRDAWREVLKADLAFDKEKGDAARAGFDKAYDAFVAKHGPINKADITYRKPTAIEIEKAREEAREDVEDRGEDWYDGSFDSREALKPSATMTDRAKARQTERVRLGDKFDEGMFDPTSVSDVPVIKRPNLRALKSDPEAFRVAALERYDDDSGEHSKRAGFRENQLTRYVEPELKSAGDGVLWSLNKFGKFDIDAIAMKMGRSPDDVAAELGDKVFRTPGTGAFTLSDEYLSGDVIDKLAEATEAAKTDPAFQRNVEALEAVQPIPIPADQITMRLGMPWIGPDVVGRFAQDYLRVGNPKVSYNALNGQWKVEESNRYGNDTEKWRTSNFAPHKLLEAALNRQVLKVYAKMDDGSKVLDEEATTLAQERVQAMKDAFLNMETSTGFVREEEGLSTELAARYNDTSNRTVPRVYDGSYLTTPGMSADVELRPHQQRVIARIVQSGNTYMAHSVGAGKAQPLDAKILTPTGWIRMGEVQIGDMVIAGDGSPTRVEGVYPQGSKEIWRVGFSDGSSTECCDEHLWLTQTYKERGASQVAAKKGKDWPSAKPRIRPLSEIRETLIAPHLGAKNHSIPIVGPVQFAAAHCPLDPYLMGLLIGDGHMRDNGVLISSADEEILESVRAAIPSDCVLRHHVGYDWRIVFEGQRRYAAGRGGMIRSHPVLMAIDELGLEGKLAHQKHIPEAYLHNTVEVRTALLQGLMDTDGWVQRKAACFCTTSKRLADDVVSLVRSLGGTASTSTKEPTYTYKGVRQIGRTAYNLHLRLPPGLNPFRLRRKADAFVPATKYQPARFITSVERVGEKIAQCIAVAHPAHLYVTDDFLVTHNTMAMIASGMEMKRLGLVRKPMYAVPNHMLGQFQKEFFELYPAANIRVADEDDFHLDVRKQWMANAAAEDLDAIIMTHAAFKKIGIGEDYKQYLIEDEIEKYKKALEEAGGDRVTVRNLQNAIEKMEDQLTAAMSNEKDAGLTFEEIGADHLFVDEAHMFRKLGFATTLRAKGITPGGSQQAWDLYTKIRWLEDNNPGRSVVLASGTPITNTMAELYTVSRYIQRAKLEKLGLEPFDAWAGTYGELRTENEPTVTGDFAPVTRFNQFVNVPELYKLVADNMDTVTPNQLSEFVVRPRLEGGARTTHVVDASAAQLEHIDVLKSRMADIEARQRPPQKGDDIILSVIGDGRMSAVDPRLVRGLGSADIHDMLAQGGHQPSKLDVMIDTALKVYHETTDHQFYDPRSNYEKPSFRGPATQMIFTNIGVHGTPENPFNTKDHIKRTLIAGGVPKNEIAFISDFKTAAAKRQLFSDMNSGRVRFMVGSTQEMGTGVNAQQRLIAIHNLDPLWYPADDEQRVGRGLRQGNHNPLIQIHDYSTKGTYDAAMWQMMAKKAEFIEAFFRGDPTVRTMMDLGAPSLYAQIAGMTAADPRLLQLADLKDQVKTAQRKESAYDSQQYEMRRKLKSIPNWVDMHEGHRDALQADIARRVDTRGDAFNAEAGGKAYTARTEAANALEDQYEAIYPGLGMTQWGSLGKVGGFEIGVKRGFGDEPAFGIKMSTADGREDWSLIGSKSSSMRGVVQAAENRMAGLEGEVEHHQRTLDDLHKQETSLRNQVGVPYPNPEAIGQLKLKVKALEEELKASAAGAKAARVPKLAREPEEKPDFAKALARHEITYADQEPVTRGLEGIRSERPLDDVHVQAVQDYIRHMVPGAEARPYEHLQETGQRSGAIEGATFGERDGMQWKHIIAWALDAGDHMGIARHETIHALRRLGLFRPGEWDTLKSAAIREGWIDRHGIESAYPKATREQKLEEAIAFEFAQYGSADRAPGLRERLPAPVRAVFDRVAPIFRQVGEIARSMFGGQLSSAEIFNRIQSGETGARTPSARGARESSRPAFAKGRGGDYVSEHEDDRHSGVSGAPGDVRGDTGTVLQRGRTAYRALGIAADLHREGSTALLGRTIHDPGDLAELAQVYRDPRYETFRIFYTKGDEIVGSTGVSARMAGFAPILPKGLGLRDLRDHMEAAKHAMEADGYYLLHNHPSGDPTPSLGDLGVTKQIADEVSGYRGHVIINSNKYAVIDRDGAHKVFERNFGEDKLLQAAVPHPVVGTPLTGVSQLLRLGKLLQKDGWVTLVGVSSKGAVRAVADYPEAWLSRADPVLAGALRRFMRTTGSGSVHLVGSEDALQTAAVRTALRDGYLRAAVTESRAVPGDAGSSPFNMGNFAAGRYVSEDEERADAERTRATGKPVGFVNRVLGHGADEVGTKFSNFVSRRMPSPLASIRDNIRMKTNPMSVGSERSQAEAKDFASTLRAIGFQWGRVDGWLEKNFTPEQRKAMWEALDEHGVLLRRGLEPGRDQGLNRLSDIERDAVVELNRREQKVWERAKSLDMTDADGLEFHAPRMIVRMSATGGPEIVSSGTNGGKEGTNLITTTGQMKQRKHETVEETEAAAKAKFGDNAMVVRDIRTVALAAHRLEQAVAGRTLVNRIKEFSDDAGVSAVQEDQAGNHDFFTIPGHPALVKWGPKMITNEETGKVEPAVDQNGHKMFTSKTLYIAKEFEGPLKAVLSTPSGDLYRAYMNLKGKTMGMIMYSPLMHNAVIWGKAIPVMVSKDPLTTLANLFAFQMYRDGYKAKTDPATMDEAIKAGVDPIGKRYFNQQLTGIAEAPTIVPGRSWTAQIVGAIPGFFSPEAGDATKRAIDQFGDLWHNTFLWDRVGDLQMGIYKNVRDTEVAKGMDPVSAQRLAAHYANRYAGALPIEAMSKGARAAANVLLFSRSFTMTNLGAFKDAITGLPSDLQAQIKRDMGPAVLHSVQGEARGKAAAMIVIDVALSFLGLTMAAYASSALTGQPFQAPWDNEPGKEKRFRIGTASDGSALYGRLPTGKVAEDMQNWVTEPVTELKAKLSPEARFAYEMITNDKGFGHKLWDPYDKTPATFVQNAGKLVGAYLEGHFPAGEAEAIAGMFDPGATKMGAVPRALLPLTGITVSKGAPGGPKMGIVDSVLDEAKYQLDQAKPQIMVDIRDGREDKARQAMTALGVAPALQTFIVKRTNNPNAPMSKRERMDFERIATPAQKEAFLAAQSSQQAAASP